MSSHYERPQSPKPYAFVPIAPLRPEVTVGHERLRTGHYTGRLLYELRVLTPLFVASGSYALGEEVGYPDEPVLRDCYRVKGTPAIPGSSLKGVVRSIAEAVSPSCVTVTRLDKRLIPHQDLPRDERCQPNNACPACSIFGRMNRMSKVFFGDAKLVHGGTQLYRLPALYAPRAHRARRTYQEDGQFKGRKFYYHARPGEDSRRPPVVVIAPKSRLQGGLDFENLTGPELGLLCYALGFDGSITLKLGGGKPVGLGTLRIAWARLTLWDGSDFTRARPEPDVLEGDQMIGFIGERMQEAIRGGLILREQHHALREILRYPTDREAPTGMY